MAKYEIMLVVSGKLNEEQAQKVANEAKANLKKVEKLTETKLGLKKLAYEINKTKDGHYFVYNFETNIPAIISEFRRLILINKDVLRHLIINLEQDYGYKAINNQKKVQLSEKKSKAYAERKARAEKEAEARKAEWLKQKESRDE